HRELGGTALAVVPGLLQHGQAGRVDVPVAAGHHPAEQVGRLHRRPVQEVAAPFSRAATGRGGGCRLLLVTTRRVIAIGIAGRGEVLRSGVVAVALEGIEVAQVGHRGLRLEAGVAGVGGRDTARPYAGAEIAGATVV